MSEPVPRSNAAWLLALTGEGPDGVQAAEELVTFLSRILGRVLRSDLAQELVPDLVQDSMLRIVENLDRFRGESAFTTWAAGVATRVALTELRRRKFRAQRQISLEHLEREWEEEPNPLQRAPSSAVESDELHDALRQAVASELTPRQRFAILAELREVPTVEIARHLNISPNALYKLVHDARKKLRRSLQVRGHSLESSRRAVPETGP